MVPCDPALLVPFADGSVAPWWSDRERTVRELAKLSPADARTFVRVDDELKLLARYLQPFFLEPPPDVHTRGFAGVMEALRVGKRFRGISGDEIARMVSFLTGSLGDFLDRNYESEKVKTLFLANNVYGKHGGPYSPGTALGLLFHLLSGGEHDLQGFYGHVMGGMGAITQAMASAARKFGAEIRTVGAGRHGSSCATAARPASRSRTAPRSPRRSWSRTPTRSARSSASSKRRSCPRTSAARSRASRWTGPAPRSTSCSPRSRASTGMPREFEKSQRALFTLVPSLEFAERCYDIAKLGEIPEELWVDCVVASNVDPSLAPEGRHVMTCFVQYVPYRLKKGTWDENRELLGDRVVRKIGEYAPNVPGSVVARQVLTPLDLERTYGLTEGNIFHGDLNLEQLFFMRPVAGCAQYRTPVDGLYLCGAGTHPGGGVTGAPGHNAARQVLKDLKRRFD